MSGIIEVSAGAEGGNFDDFIARMGDPDSFVLTTSTNNLIIFGEVSGQTGQTIAMVAVGVSLKLRLLAADGHLLMEIDWPTFSWPGPGKNPDKRLDQMMDSLQTGTLGGFGFDVSFIGRSGSDVASGGKGRDYLSGAAGNDMLAGLAGNDSIFGGSGNDTIKGGFGQDTIVGGHGLDRLSGGLGTDVFVFSGLAGLASGDKITDFAQAQGDLIDLRGVDAMTGNVGLDHFSLITTGFTGQKGELRINLTASGVQVLGDVDGDSAADFQITLLGVTSLDAGSLLLV